MTERRDQLAECNADRLPLPEFQDGWCRRCINPECTRSLFGQSRFDLRVNTWQERLFRDPPRMDPNDPRYSQIASKRFLTLDLSAPPEVRSWVDPTTHQEPTPAPIVVPVVAPEPPKPAPAPQAPAPKAQPAPTREVAASVLSMNSQSQGGRMLSGVKTSQPTTPDPWAAPEPAENVIPVGGRVKLGGSGVR